MLPHILQEGTDVGTDTGIDKGTDTGTDTKDMLRCVRMQPPSLQAGTDTGTDTGMDKGKDTCSTDMHRCLHMQPHTLQEGTHSLHHSCKCQSSAVGCRFGQSGSLGRPLGSLGHPGDDTSLTVCNAE